MDDSAAHVYPAQLAPRAGPSAPPNSQLYNEWSYTYKHRVSQPDTYKWVFTGEVEYFPLEIGKTMWIGTNYFYGCTVFAAAGQSGVILGHIQQETGPANDPICALETRDKTNRYLIPDLEKKLSDIAADFEGDISPVCNERFAWIMGSVRDNDYKAGPSRLKEFFVEGGVPADNLWYNFYSPTSGTGSANPASPGGLCLIKWSSETQGVFGNGDNSILEMFFSNEAPRIVLKFRNVDGALVLDTVGPTSSTYTTLGTKTYGDAPARGSAGGGSAELRRDSNLHFPV